MPVRAEQRFVRKPKAFWASVRTISQEVGYTKRGARQILVPDLSDMQKAFKKLKFSDAVLLHPEGSPTNFATQLHEYFLYRANILNSHVEPRLMDAKRAKREFDALRAELQPTCPIPMNKQRGDKKAESFLTGIVNMLIEAHADGLSCDYDPRQLTTITRDNVPVRTLARRVDGAFPSTVNPVAVWEIKEYYYTTTFGSRVADGVYETLLDGMELEELREHEGIRVKHYLMTDAHYTWWECGRSYLCRMVDMLHMGYVDEILFGYEVVEEMPRIVGELVEMVRKRDQWSGSQ